MSEGARADERMPWTVPIWLGLTWGFAEATLFFVVPDVVLGWACLGGMRPGIRTLAAVTIGSLAGGLLMFGLATWQPDATRAMVAHVPFVRSAMFNAVEASYRAHGAAGMLYGPSSGIPYKIYAVLAPQHFGVMAFAVMSIPARLERLILSWLVFTLLGRIVVKMTSTRRRLAAALYGVFWIGLYAFYWSSL